MKSPITSVRTKIDPIMMPGLHKGMITLVRVWKPLAPASFAASSRLRSMRIMVLKIGTTMNSVYKCTKARITAKSENKSHSSGSSITPHDISPELASPLRPRNGIQLIMRMMFDVQNGTVHSKKNTVCHVCDRM